MYTGVDNLDYNFDGIVDIDDIALVVSIIMTEKDDPQVQKLLKKFNIDPNSDTWDKDLGTALAAAGKTVGDGGEINVLIITQIIDVIAGNAQGSTYLGDCIIFFQVEGVYDPITYELIGAKKISLGKTQVNENLQRAVSAQLNNAGIQAASSVLPSSNQLNFIPTHSSIARGKEYHLIGSGAIRSEAITPAFYTIKVASSHIRVLILSNSWSALSGRSSGLLQRGWIAAVCHRPRALE